MKRKYLLAGIMMMTALSSFAGGNDNNDEKGRTDRKVTEPLPYDAGQDVNTYSYTTAIGVRGVGTSGITIKHFTSSATALEGIVGLGPDAFSATLLYEKYTTAFSEPGLNWYYGVGGHLAVQTDWVYYDGLRKYRREEGDFGIGVDGIFGIEYKINEVPIALSLDVKPFLEVTTIGAVYLAIDPGLGIKFAF